MIGMVGVRARAIMAYTLSDYKQHNSGVRFGFLFNIVEFSISMLVIALLFSLIGKSAAYGESIFLFMLTGFAPFLTFMRVSAVVGAVVDRSMRPMRAPLLSATGYAVGFSLNFLVLVPICVTIICGTLYQLGINSALPVHFEYLAVSLLAAISLGAGIGLLNAAIGYHIKVWRTIFSMLNRLLFFISGIFFVPDTMPRPIVEILEWNPLIHVIALFRLGFYKSYPTLILDVYYLAGWTLSVLFIGIWAERLVRRSYNF